MERVRLFLIHPLRGPAPVCIAPGEGDSSFFKSACYLVKESPGCLKHFAPDKGEWGVKRILDTSVTQAVTTVALTGLTLCDFRDGWEVQGASCPAWLCLWPLVLELILQLPVTGI